nr:hypothetical protein [Tanacetum cinerariifolium]
KNTSIEQETQDLDMENKHMKNLKASYSVTIMQELFQVEWNSVLMRLIDDLLALDSIVRFGFSDQRLERTATFSIPTNSKPYKLDLLSFFFPILLMNDPISPVLLRSLLSSGSLYDLANASTQLFSASGRSVKGMIQFGLRVLGLSFAGRGFNQSGLILILGRYAVLVSSESEIFTLSGIGGRSGRVVVVVSVVAVVKATGSGEAAGFGVATKSSCMSSGFSPTRATRLFLGSDLAWSSSILSSSSGGRDLGVLLGSDPSWPSSSTVVYSFRYRWLSTSSPCSSPIFRIFVSHSLITLSISSPISASAGEGVSRITLANVSLQGCAEGPVDAYLVARGVGLVSFSLIGFGLGCLVVAGLACLAGAGVVVGCIPDIVRDQLLRKFHSKDFINFAFRNELEICKTEIIFSKVKWRPRPLVNIMMSSQVVDD